MSNQQQSELAYLYNQNVQLQHTVNDLTNIIKQMQEQMNKIQLMTIANSSFLPDNQRQDAMMELYKEQERKNNKETLASNIIK